MSYSDDEFGSDDDADVAVHEDVVKRALRTGEWSETKDPASGRSYYYNPKTRETTWDLPATLRAQAIGGIDIPKQVDKTSDDVSTAFSEVVLPAKPVVVVSVALTVVPAPIEESFFVADEQPSIPNIGDNTAGACSPIFANNMTGDVTEALIASREDPKPPVIVCSLPFESTLEHDITASHDASRIRLEEVFAGARSTAYHTQRAKLTYTPVAKHTPRQVVPRLLPSRPMLRACAEEVARTESKLQEDLLGVLLRLMMKDATNATPRIPHNMHHPGISPQLSSGDDVRQLFLANLTRHVHSISDGTVNHATRLLLTDVLLSLQQVLQYQGGDDVMNSMYYVAYVGPSEFHKLAEKIIHCLPFEAMTRSAGAAAKAPAYRLESWVCSSHVVAACRAVTEALRELEVSATYEDIHCLTIGLDAATAKKKQKQTSAAITTLPTELCFALHRHQTGDTRRAPPRPTQGGTTPAMQKMFEQIRMACRAHTPRADPETLDTILDETIREVLTDTEIHDMIVKQVTVRVNALKQ